MSELSRRLYGAVDGHTADVVLALRELAADQRAHAIRSRTGAATHLPDAYLSGYLDALDDSATGTRNLADEIEKE